MTRPYGLTATGVGAQALRAGPEVYGPAPSGEPALTANSSR